MRDIALIAPMIAPLIAWLITVLTAWTVALTVRPLIVTAPMPKNQASGKGQGYSRDYE